MFPGVTVERQPWGASDCMWRQRGGKTNMVRDVGQCIKTAPLPRRRWALQPARSAIRNNDMPGPIYVRALMPAACTAQGLIHTVSLKEGNLI